MNIDAQIEAILFYKAEPISEKRLAELVGVSPEEVVAALDRITARYGGTGLALMRHDGKAMIATAPAASAHIEAMVKDELSREIGKAGIETLSIVLYRGPVARSEIDYIRGVNSAFILRALMTRGLIERIADPSHSRVPRYIATLDLLRHLGVARVEDLPDYATTRAELAAFEAKKQADGSVPGAGEQTTEETVDVHDDLEDEAEYDNEA